LEVLEEADRERVERLKGRYGDRRSYLWKEGGRLARRAGLGEVWEQVDTLMLWADLMWGSNEMSSRSPEVSARNDTAR
jgi:hypothetical protein